MQRFLLILFISITYFGSLLSNDIKEYKNPVWNMAAPDPAVIRAENGYFYAYTTQGIDPDGKLCNIQLLKSADLINWNHLGDALPEKPVWASRTQNFWAPHVIRKDSVYIMYYSAEPDAEIKKGKDLGLCIGVAISNSPEGPFNDIGKPILEGDSFINIDPMSFHDPISGKYFLYWGSGFEPLKVRELDESCIKFKEGSEIIELIKPFGANYQFLVEGSWMIYRDGWYYLFYSGDNCCGERAHYAVMVARSPSPTGPFEVLCEREEGDFAILEANEKWLASGHNSIITDDEGTDWIVYHAIDREDRWVYPEDKREDKRMILIDKIEYKDGWPYIKGNSPSISFSEAPVIEKKIRTSYVSNPPREIKNVNYVANREPLQPLSFIPLPFGQIKPKGWLGNYLKLQKDGLSGHLGEISAWLSKENNAWIEKDGDKGWEELPYWLRGHIALGCILQDDFILNECQSWIEPIIESQNNNGRFGPIKEIDGKPELWSQILMLQVLQIYYDNTKDERVLNLISDFFKYEKSLPDENFLKNYWENQRGGDNLESVLWLYNILGDSDLIDLGKKIHDNTANWSDTTAFPSLHNVNIAEGFREPASYYQITGNSSFINASYFKFKKIREEFGQVPGGMFGADENARPGCGDPRQATETCGFVEQIISDGIMASITGDPMWIDNCEDIVFNSFPATMMADMKALRYLTAPNHIISDSKSHAPSIQNDGPFLAMNPFSSRCCQHNHGAGWPFFTRTLFMATPDNGLAALSYSECDVEALIDDHKKVIIKETTDYPFSSEIKFEFHPETGVNFPFYIRIPGWAKEVDLYLNDKLLETTTFTDSYICISKEWNAGDCLSVKFPFQLYIKKWSENKNSGSVYYGPLGMSLKIDEKYVESDSKSTAIFDSEWQRDADPEIWKSYEIYPESAWNYAIEIDESDLHSCFSILHETEYKGINPFSQKGTPIRIKAKGRKIPEWGPDSTDTCGLLPDTTFITDNVSEEIELIPMGAARLRISSFPLIIKQK